MNKQNDFDTKILEDRLASLLLSTQNAALATIPVAIFYVFIQLENHSRSTLFCWLAFMIVTYLIRIVAIKKYFIRLSLMRQMVLFRLGLWVTGAGFGSMGFLFFSVDSIALQMITVILLIGIAAGGLAFLSADVTSFAVYDVLLLSPLIITSVLFGDQLHYLLAVMMAVYLLTTIRASNYLNNIVISSLKLRYENLSLVASLKEEKNRLDNRMGRILNDSLNELYILHGKTLNCKQVNKGAVINSGYSRKELTNINLLDIVTSLNRREFDTLTEPLRQGINDSVIYEGIQKRKDGSTYPVELNFQISTKEEPPVFIATSTDISKRKEAEQKLIYQANYDQLTKLPNRRFMESFIDKAFNRADRKKTKVALLFLDLNNFKDINDSLGHAVGDKLLTRVADRITLLLRDTDTPARLGGDEFLVVLEGLKHQGQAETVVDKIIKSFKEPFVLESQEIHTSAAIGVSIYPDDGTSVDLLMQYADTAMYQAKEDDGEQKYQFFSSEMRKAIKQQQNIKNRLRQALENNELSVFYQPKVNISNNTIVGAEALLRWNNPVLGDVAPYYFIPIAEKYGLINSIGAWVMEEACMQASQWQEIAKRDIHIAVNISPQQFRSNNLPEQVDSALQKSGLPGRLLEAEITESLLIQDTEEPLRLLEELRTRDVKLSLDDFGTGYSALSYLKRFPLQVLKIDRSFIIDLLENRHNKALVEAIIAMAQSLELELVAEGVETKEQLDFLRRRMVTVVQGYLFSRPVSAAEFLKLLKRFDVSY